MVTNLPKQVEAETELTIHQGMIIYQGHKEVSIDAIKDNCYEVCNIINTGVEILLNLKRLSTDHCELIKLSDFFPAKLILISSFYMLKILTKSQRSCQK